MPALPPPARHPFQTVSYSGNSLSLNFTIQIPTRYRFLEIRYHRGEQKGRLKPRVETVVIFVPDVWNLTPTKTEWEALSASYKKKFMAKYSATSSSSSVKKEAVSPPPPSVASQMIPKQQALLLFSSLVNLYLS